MSDKQVERRRISPSAGQALVLMVIALVGLLAMAALIIDGGSLLSQQRKVQNWTDSGANAGAVQLMRRLIGVAGTDAEWDQRVVDAVNESIGADGLDLIPSIEYTDIDGTVLGAAGGSTIPADTAGVRVVGQRSVGTYLAGIVGFNSFNATADATAVTGYSSGVSQGGVIPVTFPVLFTQCDGNSLVLDGSNWPVGPANPVVVPMCSNGPGNVGWIDWTPTAGGASELADAITNGNSPPISTPRWYYVTQTGSISAGPVQNAMETYLNDDVLLPIFYGDDTDPLPGTCSSTPNNDQDRLSDCPMGDRGGTGSNQWYFLVTFASFHLQEVYLNGGDGGACDPGDVDGKNISGCLIGYFNFDVVPANLTIGPGGGAQTSNLTPPTVQLID
jgi:hypothetical protein